MSREEDKWKTVSKGWREIRGKILGIMLVPVLVGVMTGDGLDGKGGDVLWTEISERLN